MNRSVPNLVVPGFQIQMQFMLANYGPKVRSTLPSTPIGRFGSTAACQQFITRAAGFGHKQPLIVPSQSPNRQSMYSRSRSITK
jgi:hypothetical protein